MTLLLTRLTYLTALPLSASEGTLFTPPVCAGAVVRGMSLEVVLTGSTHCPVSWIPAQRPLSLSMGLHGAVARARPTRAHARRSVFAAPMPRAGLPRLSLPDTSPSASAFQGGDVCTTCRA